jgi:uncharacterized protein YbjT (DUF2867 family)
VLSVCGSGRAAELIAAATVLLQDGHAGKEYVLTGPESLTRAEMVRQIGMALGREVPFVELDHDEAIAAHEPSMGEYAQWYVDGMRELTEHPQQATSLVEELTGRPGTTFAQWAARNVDWFR